MADDRMFRMRENAFLNWAKKQNLSKEDTDKMRKAFYVGWQMCSDVYIYFAEMDENRDTSGKLNNEDSKKLEDFIKNYPENHS